MAYTIEPKSTKEFIDMDSNLPRFQRKQTWKPVDNFKLCISVFKNYPIGVVIINKNGKGNWLLDGRQRRNALSKMSSNPIEIYEWSRRFIGFKNSSDENEIKNLYWEKINEYLKRDFQEDVYKEENNLNVDEEEKESLIESDEKEDLLDSEALEDTSFTYEDQMQGLKILLDLILMVHSIKNGRSKWERMFDFRDWVDHLSYFKVREGKEEFVPEALIKTMNEIMLNEKNKKN